MNTDRFFYEKQSYHIAYSFIDLIAYIFTIPGVKSFLSERLSQDPLEKFFGRQRQRGCRNENPNVKEFLVNNQALRIVDSIKIDTEKGNTRGSNTENITVVSDGPLPKRRIYAKDDGMCIAELHPQTLQTAVPTLVGVPVLKSKQN